jgi:hypothetical protein
MASHMEALGKLQRTEGETATMKGRDNAPYSGGLTEQNGSNILAQWESLKICDRNIMLST